ncbi:PulJ/GspJ family protein [Plebeiibacterium sediminum]|uniref:Prepilin-type N-terminal cleavage/methylation domain-containing protein n=1 Tax=Plebeiibacterium sediminum TaxID=2992112 RepID=A0AAE3M7D7_9BACT|nr:prepilin-type N-terminal cleavage/methylation domain-containing protein [Plebeiobacterium sediminum]MCW3787900.1 prepilin-type N-terminal cleavage/methylation domain-containing protein [Plebeiobacterium sediminum]
MKKMNGFTIHELLIVMIITSIVILLSYTVIQNYYQLFSEIVDTGNSQTEINQFYQLLIADFDKAEVVTFNGKLQCDVAGEMISYEFDSSFVARVSVYSIDTIRLSCTNTNFTYANESSGLINYFSVVCNIQKVEVPISIYKQYPIGKYLEIKE